MIMEKHHPLVTVGVATYNSSRFIIEALNSIYNQTYDNIELIISDDASSDETVKFVQDWLALNKTRFARFNVITVNKNTGTSFNLNRIIKEATGEWIKFIAGDDVLLPNCITDNISYISSHREVKWLFSKAIFYKNTIAEDCIIESKTEMFKMYSDLNNIDADEQFKRNYIGNYFKAPTHFFRKDLLDELGGFDEEFGILEDYPMWLKILSKGEKCYFYDDNTVGYRFSDTNMSMYNDRLVNRKMFYLTYNVQRKYILNVCPLPYKMNIILRYNINRLFSVPFLNKKTKIRLLVYRFLLRSADIATFGHIYQNR